MIDSALAADNPAASVACIVKLKTPATLGVPLKPPVALSDKPVGSAPDANAKRYGAAPPMASRFWLYVIPIEPFGSADVENTSAPPAAIVMLKIFETVAPVPSVACTANVKEPGAVGVPFKKPAPERVSPGGSDPAPRVYV